MLTTAAASIRNAGLKKNIKLACRDVVNFDCHRTFGVSHFDRIIISYALSMIPQWQLVLHRAVGMLAPDGTLHIVDFGQQTGLPKWFKQVLFTWLAHFSVTPRVDFLLTLETLAGDGNLAFQFESFYRGYAYYAVLKSA